MYLVSNVILTDPLPICKPAPPNFRLDLNLNMNLNPEIPAHGDMYNVKY